VNTNENCGTLDLIEAAQLCKCSAARLRRLASSGVIPATKIGRRWVFPARLLQEWIEQRSRANVVGKPYFALRRVTIAQALTLNSPSPAAPKNN
jgi:excisionase family DNA binding protein